MHKQWKQNLIVISTAIVLGGFSITCMVKQPTELSRSERRKLEQFPKLTMETIRSGSFMKKFDKYSADQFPLRDEFRSLYAHIARDVMNRSDVEGIYVMDGHAVSMEYPLDHDSLAHACDVFQSITKESMEGHTGKIYLAMIPDKNYFFRDDSSVLSMDYDTLFETMEKGNPNMTPIDIASSLALGDYYRTDPHWRQEKILDVANVLTEAMNRDASARVLTKDMFQSQVATKTFYGTYAGQAALPFSADTVKYMTHPDLEECRVYDHQNNREIPMYDLEKADGLDPYELFLDGPLSYVTIENPKATTKKELVLFRDSFGSAIAPYLAMHYEKITMLDVRYLSRYLLPSLVTFKDQDVLFLYSTSVLNNSETLK